MRTLTQKRTYGIATYCMMQDIKVYFKIRLISTVSQWWTVFLIRYLMHSSTHFQSPPTFVEIYCSCDKVYHKQEVHIILYILGQIVTWQHIPNPLDENFPCTVINDHDWQLWNCPLKSSRAVAFCASIVIIEKQIHSVDNVTDQEYSIQ